MGQHGCDEQDEARWTLNTLEDLQTTCPLSEMAVLVRTNAQTRAIEEEMIRRGVLPAELDDMPKYEPPPADGD